ncbi:unnamed protein product [Pylaiella littoralis]
MSSAEEDWFANLSNNPGPSLEDFLATDPSHLPFLQEQPATAEDLIRYQIFADDWGSIEHLQQLRKSVLQLVESSTTGFIWHREAFALSVAVPMEGDLEPHLAGEQVVGGNVSDEWFVCYLLFTITSTFPTLTACVTDSDGEFLLIEAATAIPPFLSPANSNHRVWVRSGQVHLVMPGCMVDRARTPRTLGSGSIAVSEGLKAIRESDGGTEADEGVQRLIRRRIGGYPHEAKASMHHARCFLPLPVALAIRDTPGLVAPAVRAFCSGGYADKKLGVRMARLLVLPTGGSGANIAGNAPRGSQAGAPIFVEARVAFTRQLYAQLHQAAAVPGKDFPPGWGPDRSTLSPAAHTKAAQLGQKLSMGLEAAYQACYESCSKTTRGDLRSAIRPEAWKRFLDRLARNGFFEGELEGSKRYREKISMAEQFVRNSVLHVDDGADEEVAAAQRDLRRCPVHEVVDRALSSADRDNMLEPSVEEDDKEDWLEVSQADLDIMLQDYRRAEVRDTWKNCRRRSDGGVVGGDHEQDGSYFRSAYAASSVTDEVAADERKKAQESQAGFADAVDGLDDIVSGMNAFVDDSRAGLDGAEVEPVGGHVQFDVDKFMSLLNGEDLMSALEDAAKEGGNADLHESDDDLLESSEEEDDDDMEQGPQRMPEPRGFKARPEDSSVSGSRNHSNSTCDVPGDIPTEKGDRGDGVKGRNYHVRTRVGTRPSVAFQMQEMEGRPREEDDQDASLEESDAQRQDGGRESKGDTGSTENFVRDYMAAMEAELDPSTIGQSFEKVGDTISKAQMEELQTVGPLDQNTGRAEEWLRQGAAHSSTSEGDEPDHEPDKASDMPAEDYKPVDVDMNMVKHLLESTVSQGGLSGPASNLLRSMGLSFPSVPVGGAKNDTTVEEI